MVLWLLSGDAEKGSPRRNYSLAEADCAGLRAAELTQANAPTVRSYITPDAKAHPAPS